MTSLPSGERRLLCISAVVVTLASLLGKPGITAPTPGLLLAASGGLAILCGWVCERRGFRKGTYLGPVLACALLLWSGLSAVSSLDLYLSSISLLSLCGATAVLTALHLGIMTQAHWRLTSYALVFGALLSVLSAWPPVLRGDSGRLSANFTNPDCYSVIPLIGFCLAASLLGGASGWSRTALMATCSLFFPTLLLTQSRSAVLGMVIAVVWVGYLAWRRRQPATIRSLWLAVLSMLPAVLFLAVSTLWQPSLARWARLVGNEDTGAYVRVSLLEGSLACARSKPLLGSGPGTFALAFQETRPLDIGTHEYANVAHNDSLQFLVECGLPALLLWMALSLVALRCVWKSSRHSLWESEASWTGSALLGMFVYSQFNFAVPVPATLLWWFAVLGLAFALPEGPADPRELPSRGRTVMAGTMVLVGCFSLVFGFRICGGQHFSRLAEHHTERLQWPEAYQAWGRAIWLEPGNVEHRLARAVLAEDLALLMQDKQWLSQAEHDLKKARAASPRSLPVLIHSYRFLTHHDRRTEAEQLLAQARAFAPYEPHFARYLAGSLVRRRDLAGAARTLAQAGGGPEMANLVHQLERLEPGQGLPILALFPEAKERSLIAEVLRLAAREPTLLDRYYGRLYSLTGERRSELQLEWGLAVDRAGDETRGLTILKQLLSEHKPEEPAYEAALVEVASREPNGTERLREYVATHPRKSRARVALSRALPSDEALDYLTEALARQPNDPFLLIEIGDIYERDGLADIAVEYYVTARKRRPDDPILTRKIEELETK